VPYATPVTRILLLLGALLNGLLSVAPVSAQSTLDPPGTSIINKPMSPPPARIKPTGEEPHARLVQSDRHPPVRFSVATGSDKLNLRLYQERGMNAVLGPGGNRDSSELVPMCSPPCEVSLRSRAYVLAVSSGDRGAVKIDPVLNLHDGDHMEIHYQSRMPLRVLGWVLLLAGTTAGGILFGLGLPAQQPNVPSRIAGGAALLGVSLGCGLWFVNVPDSARAVITR